MNWIVEFDDRGHGESDLATIWCDATEIGKRNHITSDAELAEKLLIEAPDEGIRVTDGVHPVVRYLDCGILRVFYQVFDEQKKVIIIGFRLLP